MDVTTLQMTSIFVKEGGTEQKFEDLNFEELVRGTKEFPGED